MKSQSIMAIVCTAVLIALDVSAATFLEGKIVMSKDYDVNVTVLRWGAAADGVTSDEIVGQVASIEHKSVILVFDVFSPTNKLPLQRLTIDTKTNIYGPVSEGGQCVYCGSHLRTGGSSTRSRGARTTGGCFFAFVFPRMPGLTKAELVNVLVDGRPVKYFTKFNASNDLMRSPLKVPKSRSARFHEPKFEFTPLAVSETVPAAPAPAAAANESAQATPSWEAEPTAAARDVPAPPPVSTALPAPSANRSMLSGAGKASTPAILYIACDNSYTAWLNGNAYLPGQRL